MNKELTNCDWIFPTEHQTFQLLDFPSPDAPGRLTLIWQSQKWDTIFNAIVKNAIPQFVAGIKA